MHDLFEGLNDRQREAVAATEGRIRVVAGAGSGKTRVLAHRFAYIVDEIGVNPANILCMTFTNKAAQEMRTRISRLVGAGMSNDLICTIHGFCVKLLRRDIYRIGYPKSFGIIDEEDSKSLAKQAMEANGLDRAKDTVRLFLERVDIFKSTNDYISTFLIPDASGLGDVSVELKPIVDYINLQRQYYVLDFQDIINFALYLLERFEAVRDYWQTTLNYVQVDEVQDCNSADWRLINILTEKSGNLFIVGDPDQAIYEWRGARPNMFVDFKSDSDIILAQNYRSTPDILDVANSVIANNRNRIPKDLVTGNKKGKKAVHYHARNDRDEAAWIARQIQRIVKSHSGNTFSDVAVLYRASYLSRTVEKEFIERHIPYTIWGGIRFFERAEIKNVLAYLKLVDNPDDDLSLRRIINVPARKFGKVSLKKLADLAAAEHASLYATLRRNIDKSPFNKPELKSFVELIEDVRSSVDGSLISELVEDLMTRSGLTDLIRNDEEEERLENVKELINDIRNYEADHVDDLSLSNYLQDIALYTNVDMRNDSDVVRLMTMHQAKGLEFPYVFVCGLSEGIFPSHRSLRERQRAALEEERRLMYVAITRAENELFLTESEGYNISTQQDKVPSRFLTEIKDNLIRLEGHMDPYLYTLTRRVAQEIDSSFGENAEPTNKFAAGMSVEHRIFGIGTVVTATPPDANGVQSVVVEFSVGSRTIMSNKLIQHK